MDEPVKDVETGLWKQLGKVVRTSFEIEDHGILTLSIDIKFGVSAQGFGRYSLDTWDKVKDRRVGTAAGMDFILRILQLFDVRSLDELRGRPVYALRKSDEWGEFIIGLKTPDFDGKRTFLVSDWQREWFPNLASTNR